jgi:hypothetical protein
VAKHQILIILIQIPTLVAAQDQDRVQGVVPDPQAAVAHIAVTSFIKAPAADVTILIAMEIKPTWMQVNAIAKSNS